MRKFSRVFNIKLNPLLAYLLKRRQLNIRGEVWHILRLWLIDAVFVSFLYTGGDAPNRLVAVLGAVFILMMFVPILIAYLSASAASRFVASQSYDLLALTDLSDKTILWSYLVASLYRLRTLLVIVIGLVPVFAMMAALAWLIWLSRFETGPCIPTPIGNTFCEEPLIYQNRPALIVGMIATLIILAITSAGIYLLTAVAGIIIGFAQKNHVIAVAAAGSIGLVMGLLIGVVLMPEMVLAKLVQSFDGWIVIIALIPFALAFELIQLSGPLVRRAS